MPPLSQGKEDRNEIPDNGGKACTPQRRNTIEPNPFSPRMTRSRQLTADFSADKASQSKKNLAPVVAKVQEDLSTQPCSIPEIEGNEDIPPELSYSLGPLDQGGMSD